jgi:hypothetical protein
MGSLGRSEIGNFLSFRDPVNRSPSEEFSDGSVLDLLDVGKGMDELVYIRRLGSGLSTEVTGRFDIVVRTRGGIRRERVRMRGRGVHRR